MGKVSMEWCPTPKMIADFMTKPLQGALFVNFGDLIMGITSMKDDVGQNPVMVWNRAKETCVPQGCVGRVHMPYLPNLTTLDVN